MAPSPHFSSDVTMLSIYTASRDFKLCQYKGIILTWDPNVSFMFDQKQLLIENIQN
jgi:hypothetical protein